MWGEDFRLGVYDALQAKAAAVVAANPHAAKRILGERAAVCRAVITAPIVLAGHERKAGRAPASPEIAKVKRAANPKQFRKSKYPWRTMGLNQSFDVDSRITRRCVVKQAGVYRRQMGRQYDVKLLLEGGRSVIRVTRTA